jgi:hypothetical protein
MKTIRRMLLLIVILLCSGTVPLYAAIQLDERPGAPGEWGFRPLDDSISQVNPPGFSWRPQEDAVSYEIQCSQSRDFASIDYKANSVEYTVHTPSQILQPGTWYWRFRAIDKSNTASAWSSVRAFSIAENANELVLPAKADLMKRIPVSHPRLFVRPEEIPELRQRAKTDLSDAYKKLLVAADKIVSDPPPTQEPEKYGDYDRKSPEWLTLWWGNRTYTQKALGGAAELGFVYQLSQNRTYGDLAKKILLECAEWEPRGSTGYRYNDEAGMPYNYYFSRTYTFVNDLLSQEEKEKCQAVMTERGKEMYNHLHPRHLWKPYASHSNRAWHFLGEIGIAFLHEIPEAQDWVWFAANVFTNVYPVWSDDDGGWHEGSSYWNSYVQRFTWWADIMKSAMNINAFDKPYFSQIGYYPMYLQPPGTQGGGFGDLCASKNSTSSCGLMAILAAQAQNPYWQWYVDVQNRGIPDSGYVGFLRQSLKKTIAKAPTDLPTSRLFKGTGQAYLNTTLLDAKENVEVIFKSSPFGTQSHGYEAQNSFLLYAFGERLFIRSGKRDYYGSPHHTQWMWYPKSTNTIGIHGTNHYPRDARSRGQIIDFETNAHFDYVAGEAKDAYPDQVEQFTRRILFVKPDIILMFDTVKTQNPTQFDWYLHSVNEMDIQPHGNVYVENGNAACQVNFLYPKNLKFSQHNQFDPKPTKGNLVEYHLAATTPSPGTEQNFVTLFFPHKKGEMPARTIQNKLGETQFSLEISQPDQKLVVLLQSEPGELKANGLTSTCEVKAVLYDNHDKEIATFSTNK